ncbi:MAG TPA: xanthine dehydrogenase [Tissierellia bacterium]|nr:xanthine dehydrogenase [Tissierellia bacterium]
MFFELLQQLDKSKENIVFTVISGKNSGAKLLLSDGEKVYTNNELYNWDSVIKLIPADKKSKIINFEDEKVYVEFISQDYNVVVCGAGHISIAIIKMCKLLNLHVTVIDDRIKFTDNARNAGADRVICESFVEALCGIEGSKSTFFIIVTRGHRHDQDCLEEIITKENAYIGMIGSRVRVRKVLDYLEEKGIPREKLDKVYTPIGLNIGAETPEEIAVSIMAELIEVKNKGIGYGSYPREVIDGILSEKYKDIPKAIVTIVSRRGSAPREVGTKMLVLKDGNMIGTIGGGCVEADIRQSALSAIENQECRLVQVDMTGLDAEEEGMVCGGIVEIFVEPIK